MSLHFHRSFKLAYTVTLMVVLAGVARLPLSGEALPRPTVNEYGKLPLSFTADQGQEDAAVRFSARGKGYGLSLTEAGATLVLQRDKNHADLVQLRTVGARPTATPQGLDELPGKANYFLGNDPAKWHTNVPTYARVRYPGVYPGVDLVYYGNQGQLEYDFVVAPGASVEPVRLEFAGVGRLTLTREGDLSIKVQDGARAGELAFKKPVVYQTVAGVRKKVEGRFRLIAGNTVAFTVGPYDHSQPLVIDPTLSYSTYLGGSTSETGAAIAVDSTGAVYVTGLTRSANFPTTSGAFQTTFAELYGDPDVFVAKLSPDGKSVVYSTYLGGTTGDYGQGIAVDSAGNAYITGYTYSSNYPTTTGALQTTNKGFSNNVPNVFVTKLNAAGAALVYSTYLGGGGSGSNGDQGAGIAIDTSGDAYVTGYAYSSNFPTTGGAFQVTNKASGVNGQNVFVSKINPTGTALLYSTYLGGSGNPNGVGFSNGPGDSANAIALDNSGNAYVVGLTNSTNFPTTAGAFQTVNNTTKGSQLCYNGFITKLNPAGTALVYSTYLGGSGTASICDSDNALAVDGAGEVYVGGVTGSSDFPATPGAYQTTNTEIASVNFSGIVAKLNAAGTALVYATYLGGTTGVLSIKGTNGVAGLAIDGNGDAYVVGDTTASDYPVTSGAYQSTNKAAANLQNNAFVTELNPSGSALLYSTYFGGSGSGSGGDAATAVALDTSGNAYFVGTTYSSNFPVSSGAYQTTTKATGGTAFIAKLSFAQLSGAATATVLTASPNPQTAGSSVTFKAVVAPVSGTGTPTGSVAFSVDGTTASTVTLDSTGTATYSTSSLSQGAHTILAAYGGDSTYAPSDSSTLSQTINGIQPVFGTISFSPSASVPYKTSQAVTISDTLAYSGAAPTGAVTFVLNGVTYTATCTTAGSPETCSAVVPAATVAALPALTYTVTGSVAADKIYAAATAPSGAFTIATGGACSVPTAGNGTMNVTYYTIAKSDRDGASLPLGLSSNYVLPALGMNGLPVYNTAATASTGSIAAPKDLLADNEITWWSPALNNGGAGGGSDVMQTGTGSVSLPFTNNGFFPPNGTGPNDLNGFQAAVFTGTLNAPTAETVSFTIGSDDMAFVYLDGQVVCNDGGVHSSTSVPCTTSTVAAGVHKLQLFYVDLDPNSAGLNFTVSTSNVSVGPTTAPVFGSIMFSPAATEVAGTSQAITISDTLTYAAQQPTGAVAYLLNGVSYPASCTSTGSPETCTATVPATAVAALQAGSYTVTGSFAGDCSYAAATAPSGTLTITTATAATPTFSLTAGTYTGTQTVTISDTTAGATIYYTTNGTTPTTSSTQYTDPLTVSATETIEAIAVVSGYTNSAVATAAFTINAAAAPGVALTSSSSGFVYGASGGTVTLTATANPLEPFADGYSWTIYDGTNALTSGAASNTATGFTFTTAVLTAGSHSFKAVYSSQNTTQYPAGTSNLVTVTVGQATPAITWATPAAVTAGTALSSTQLDATATGVSGSSLPGSFSYTPAAGTVLNTAGPVTLSATFTPTDSVDYTTATASVTLTVNAVVLPVAATPVFSPMAGAYTSAQSVTITDATGGATIYYTTNGATPTPSSTQYTGAITVSATQTLQAVAVASGYTNSAVATAVFTITPVAAGKLATSTSLAATGTAGNYTLTATVTAFGTVAPTGTVAFNDTSSSNAPVGTATLASSSLASTFVAAAASATGNGPGAIALADLNGDGKLDEVTGNNNDGTISVLLGNGDGTFKSAVSYGVNDSFADGVVIADFNGDKKLDIAVANFGGSIAVLLGNGDGTFQPAKNYPAGTGLSGLTVADFNGDGNLDLATPDKYSNAISMLLGNGDGTFKAAVTYPAGDSIIAITSADFNKDGKPDIAVCNQGDNTVGVLLGNGDGTFQKQQTFATGSAPYFAASADLNGDGKPDLVTGNSGDTTVSVLLGNGDGTFQKQVTYPAGTSPEQIAIADYNLDGKLDLAVGLEANSVSVLLGKGDGTFAAAQTYVAQSAAAAITAQVATGDFNNDGRPDIATDSTATSNAAVLLGALTDTATLTGATVTGSTAQLVDAVYPGDTNYLGSTSNTVSLSPVVATPDFSMTSSTSTLSIAQGQSGTATLTLTPANGFNQAVTFACSGLPSEASCSFSPATVTPSGAAATTTLTVTTTAPTALFRQDAAPWQRARGFQRTLALALFLGCFGAWRKRRSALGIGLVILLGACLALPLAGCGSGTSNSGGTPSTNPGTPTGTQQITVTASSAGTVVTQHTVTLSLTITP